MDMRLVIRMIFHENPARMRRTRLRRNSGQNFTAASSKYLTSVAFFFYVFVTCCDGLNVDKTFPIVFSGDPDSYFGYSVAFHRNSEGPLALISATRANSTYFKNSVFQPGVVYKCPIEKASTCQEIIFERKANYQRESYNELKNGMWLGVSLDVQPTEDANVVACAHLCTNRNFAKVHLANGMCYVINKELDSASTHKLLPMIDPQKQSFTRIYYYAYAQAGSSATYSQDGKYLILGAPGFYNWLGTVVGYSATRYPRDMARPIVKNPPGDEVVYPETYIGYSVTTGHFFEVGNTYYVAGAPRDGANKGRVYIFEAFKRDRNSKIRVKHKKEGTQMGEYFGACVLGVDLNNDGFTDLLVGAPLYSLHHGGDEGKVYLFMSNGMSLHQKDIVLMGSKKPFARFGSSIAKLGDINLDRFQDVAIGAPYEDGGRGAVYIYHGTDSGLQEKYAQRIAAEDIKVDVPLNGFGASIAAAKDIDMNHYPDMLIGSYASDRAVVLRSHPVVYVDPSIKFNISQINMDQKYCLNNGKPVTCLLVEYCLSYRGEYVPQEISFIIHLEIDARSKGDKRQSRGYFPSNGQTNITEEILVRLSDRPTCLNKVAYIIDKVDDFNIPVQFSMSYRLTTEPSERKEYCAECPVLDDLGKTTTFTKEISFQRGCGDDDICHSHLRVTADVEHLGSGSSLIVGENTSFIVNVVLANMEGEPAYQPKVIIDIPGLVEIVNTAGCKVEADPKETLKNQTLVCSGSNPLRKGEKDSFQIKLSLHRLNSTVKEIVLHIHAKTDSELISPMDSQMALLLPLSFVADITVDGFAETSQETFEDKKIPDEVFLTHTFVVRKFLPSPVQSVKVSISFPTKFMDTNEEFIRLEDIEVEDGREISVSGSCNVTLADTSPTSVKLLGDQQTTELNSIEDKDETFNGKKKTRRKRDNVQLHLSRILTYHPKAKSHALNCLTSVCTTISCVSGPFLDSRKTANFKVTAVVDLPKLLKALGEVESIEITSQAHVWIKDEGFSPQPENHKPDFTTVTTTLMKGGMKPRELPSWVIPVAIGVGVLILVLILAGLVHFGFFRRKKREELRKMMQNGSLKDWDSSDDENSKMNGDVANGGH